jgi:hypothetical protein
MKDKISGIPGVDPTLPTVSYLLRGKTFNLSLSFKALILFEQVTGMNPLAGFVVTPLNVSALLWAALLAELPDLTLEEVQESLAASDAPVAIAALGDLLLAQRTATEGEGKPPADPPNA